MIKSESAFDDFFVATVLADLFDQSGSDDIDLIATKIVDGLELNGMLLSMDKINENLVDKQNESFNDNNSNDESNEIKAA